MQSSSSMYKGANQILANEGSPKGWEEKEEKKGWREKKTDRAAFPGRRAARQPRPAANQQACGEQVATVPRLVKLTYLGLYRSI